ncbi:hypothetical protein K1719_008989 [Acacia pycnantha]|nr:hypothetical protein K1719_008989 [Acacia pycnantha]
MEKSHEFGCLFRLKKLFFSNNTLTVEIPWNSTSCTELRILFLDGNSLTGTIPYQLGALQKLKKLQLSVNNLSGEIPLSIGNLTSLTYLALSCNTLEGSILAEEIGQLKNLTNFAAPVRATTDLEAFYPTP